MSRTLMRYSQVRRVERVDSPADDSGFVQGRYFQADCPATDTVGNFVYVTGPSSSGVVQVAKVDIKTEGMFPAVGMIIEKTSITRCLVIVFGEVAITPAILTPGRRCWINDDGVLTDTFPQPAIGERLATQSAGYAIDTGRLLINLEPRPVILVG